VARKRLTRITTRTGDAGESGLADGSRRRKTDPIYAGLGDLDELNSVLGVAIAALGEDELTRALRVVQSRLFDLGGAIAIPRSRIDFDAEVEALDRLIAVYNATLPSLTNFVLPGGEPAAAALHHARSVCRRAERTLWTLHAVEPFADRSGLVYLNRLSDLLFVFARVANRARGQPETLWSPRMPPPSEQDAP
jgi:cob(I)alamin adenosyltransferase